MSVRCQLFSILIYCSILGLSRSLHPVSRCKEEETPGSLSAAGGFLTIVKVLTRYFLSCRAVRCPVRRATRTGHRPEGRIRNHCCFDLCDLLSTLLTVSLRWGYVRQLPFVLKATG